MIARRLIAGLCALMLSAAQLAAATCRLALVLAVDVSSSISEEEYALQRAGLASALLDDGVAQAILDQSGGHVALSVFEWSGRSQQRLVQDWIVLDSFAEITSAAQTILSHSRSYRRYPTSMGHALAFAADLFRSAPACERKIIDVSGDGISNDGPSPAALYRLPEFAEITVNGLAIKGQDPDVLWYYETEVLHGALAFREVAEGFDDFARAMTRKLHREVGTQMIGTNGTKGGQFAPHPKS